MTRYKRPYARKPPVYVEPKAPPPPPKISTQVCETDHAAIFREGWDSPNKTNPYPKQTSLWLSWMRGARFGKACLSSALPMAKMGKVSVRTNFDFSKWRGIPTTAAANDH
jgi:hypothetical protein